jgi:hypothetical protein
MRDLYDILTPKRPPRRHDFDDFTDPPEDTLDDISEYEYEEDMDSLDAIIEDIINPPSDT